MDSKELRGIMEAYQQMYAPQEDTEQLDEISYGLALRASKAADIKRGKLAHAGDKEGAADKAAQAKRLYQAQAKKRLNREEFENWVNALVEEGYDLSDYTWDEMYEFYLDEAEGSYGQTPKARQAMGKLAIARREKPASEYSQKGEKTKKVKAIEKHTRRMDNGPDVGHSGKKSSKPRHSGFLGKSGRGKLDQDSRDYARDSAVEYTAGGHKPGPGTVTKNPKKLRKQKAMGEIGEQLDIFDVVLEFLQVEGYAETLEEAEWMMANLIDEEAIDIILGEALTGERYKKVMKKPGGTAYSRKVSADPAKRATRGGRGGESDFGAGDRGAGNKAARRAGTYQEEYVDEAQHARENPEKYEREQAKKSAPVRGERTPMPPRGDKRREDFEKWYAKQMGR